MIFFENLLRLDNFCNSAEKGRAALDKSSTFFVSGKIMIIKQT